MGNKAKFLLMGVMALIVAGCVGKTSSGINDVSELKGKVIGMVASSDEPKNIEAMLTNFIGAAPKEVLYFNRGADVVAAILAGKVDAAPALNFFGDYYVKRNPSLKMFAAKSQVAGGVIMVLRSEDAKLKEDLDKAIDTLQASGTLKALEDKWITNLPVGNEPANKEIEKIKGAKTVYVGVSGDFVPLDYIAADGRPAGYNVAILTEIGKLLKINFEFVSLDTQAKYAALGSKKIDVVFCQLYNNQVAPLVGPKDEKYITTKPYYTCSGGYFLVKK